MNSPFKSFAAGEPEVDRPYPPTGLTTELWRHVSTIPVYLADLHLTQRSVWIAPLFGVKDAAGSTDVYPHVVSWRGELYLEDGHTRVLYQALAGTRVMRMRVFVQREDV